MKTLEAGSGKRCTGASLLLSDFCEYKGQSLLLHCYLKMRKFKSCLKTQSNT